jgi:hypothetical protein
MALGIISLVFFGLSLVVFALSLAVFALLPISIILSLINLVLYSDIKDKSKKAKIGMSASALVLISLFVLTILSFFF